MWELSSIFVRLTCRVTPTYLKKTLDLLRASLWTSARHQRKSDLYHLIGVLTRIASCVRNGRLQIFYLRRVLSNNHYKPDHAMVPMDHGARAEAQWWSNLCAGGEVVCKQLPSHPSLLPSVAHGQTDSCWESYGGIWREADGSYRFFFGWFSTAISRAWPIVAKESFAIACLVLLRGPSVEDHVMLVESDSEDSVITWNKGSPGRSEPGAMMLRAIDAAANRARTVVTLRHIAGVDNVLADAVSRAEWSKLESLIGVSPLIRVHVPQEWTKQWSVE